MLPAHGHHDGSSVVHIGRDYPNVFAVVLGRIGNNCFGLGLRVHLGLFRVLLFVSCQLEVYRCT